MGGDQLNQLISEYINNNLGFIVFVCIVLFLCFAAIIFGIVMSIIQKSRQPKEVVENASLNNEEGGQE